MTDAVFDITGEAPTEGTLNSSSAVTQLTYMLGYKAASADVDRNARHVGETALVSRA